MTHEMSNDSTFFLRFVRKQSDWTIIGRGKQRHTVTQEAGFLASDRTIFGQGHDVTVRFMFAGKLANG